MIALLALTRAPTTTWSSRSSSRSSSPGCGRFFARRLGGPLVAFEVGDLAMDTARKRVCVGGARVDLSPTEFAILELLMSHAPASASMSDLPQWSCPVATSHG